MKKLWIAVGRVMYIVVWPALYVYLRYGGERTRIVVTNEDQIILVQNWLGNGQWMLPGGDVYGHERPTNSAVRELREETGLRVKPRDLRFVGNASYKGKSLNIVLACYHLKLKARPELNITRQLEVVNIKWADLKTVLTNESLTPDTRQVIELWSQRSGFEATD